MRRDMLLQEFHLVHEDPAIGKDQVFGLVRHIRRIQELGARFLGGAVALHAVAMPAGGDHVHPGIPATAGQRLDMVAGQPEVMEIPSAICTQLAVAAEQFAIVERRDLVEAFSRHRLALDGDDGVCGDARALARQVGDAAVESEGPLPHRPGDEVLGVVEAGLLPADPAVRHAVVVQRKDEGSVHGLRMILPISPGLGNPRKNKGL